jgi:hypothetical protein
MYQTLGKYNLFSSLQNKPTSLVLLKEPVYGKVIQDYFPNEGNTSKLKKTLNSYARMYELNRVYQPTQR